ncbi:uncharacterized protein [Amphiura filiformis]|uniref:uncharacterized protein isoform X2 n=1 Tax=Amphiura filiformis TaxID=82378 RepID=UPI003B20B9F6
MGAIKCNTLFGILSQNLIVTISLIFLFIKITPGFSELDKFGGENVCGPRIIYGNFSTTVREVVSCPAGSCVVYKIRYVSQLDEYYCCPGFSQTDTSCSKACDSDRFGENCTQLCTCHFAHANCSAVTGECECVPGRQGANCTDVCQGTYGVNCRGTCECNTADSDAKCHPVDGACTCSSPKYYGDKCEFRYDSTTDPNHHTNTKGSFTNNAPLLGSNSTSKIIVPVVVCFLLLIIAIALLMVWKYRANGKEGLVPWILRKSSPADEDVLPNTQSHVDHVSDGTNGNVPASSSNAGPSSGGNHNSSYDGVSNYSSVLPLRESTGDQVELDAKYTSVKKAMKSESTPKQNAEKVTKNNPSVPQRKTSNESSTSKGLPAYAQVDKSQSKSVKNKDAVKPPAAKKPLLKSKTLPAKERGVAKSPSVPTEPPVPPYATIEETLDLKWRKSDTLPAYASIGETFPSSNDIDDATGKDNAYDLLNPDTMKEIQSSTQPSPSTAAQEESTRDYNPYAVPASSAPSYASPNSLPAQKNSDPQASDTPAAPTYAAPNSVALSQNNPPKARGVVGDPYGVIDLSKTDLSHGEREIKRANSTSSNSKVARGFTGDDQAESNSKDQSSSNTKHLYATLEEL